MFHVDLADGWALRCDALQWMLCHQVGKPGKRKWSPVSFHTRKNSLQRVIEEKGVILGAAGVEAIASLPATFREFREAQRRAEG